MVDVEILLSLTLNNLAEIKQKTTGKLFKESHLQQVNIFLNQLLIKKNTNAHKRVLHDNSWNQIDEFQL